MATDRQIAANRANAKNSTGPRSKKGKANSSRNAFRHGLSIQIKTDIELNDDVRKLLDALAVFDRNEKPSFFAHQAAEAEIDLVRINRVRATILHGVLGQENAQLEDYERVNSILASLERYERRAFSRRKRAFRGMEES